MYSPIWAKFLIIIFLIYSAQVLASETDVLQTKISLNIRSIRPLSNHSLDGKTIKQLKADTKIIRSNNKKHIFLENDLVYGGGYGGNEGTGPLFYDGRPEHFPALIVRRDTKNETCYLENQDTSVYQYRYWFFLRLVSYGCAAKDKTHNDIYWNDKLDGLNGSYSSANDALYAGKMINAMYLEWFGISALQNADGSSAPLEIVVHMSLGDAFAHKGRINLGDGDDDFYPFTSPGVISFIAADLFTTQHSNLAIYDSHYGHFNQSAAISLAFSSMADQAIKFYISGQSDWEIGSEISKEGQPIYYLDQPSKDCGSRRPGNNCSIDHFSQYKDQMDAYFTSGIYRRALYLLATTPGWDVKKAFSIMVQANRFYWTSKEDFSQGLCGLIKAARDYHYDEVAVINAFSQVGVSSPSCDRY